MDPATEGKIYGPVAFELAEDRVRAFGELFGGPTGVPPTFLTAAEFMLIPEIVGDPELGLDFSKVVHGSQEYEFRRALRVGEVLSVEARIVSIRHKGGNGFLNVEMTMRGPDGEIAALTRSTMVERGSGG